MFLSSSLPFFFLLRFCFCFFCHSSLHQRLTFLPYTHITINGDFAILYTLPDMDESVRCFCNMCDLTPHAVPKPKQTTFRQRVATENTQPKPKKTLRSLYMPMPMPIPVANARAFFLSYYHVTSILCSILIFWKPPNSFLLVILFSNA